MATTSEPQGGFRLSQLIYDTRYRSITIQVIAIILLGLAIWGLMSNLFANLAERGLNIRWGFLGEPSSYDINQRLLDYNSRR